MSVKLTLKNVRFSYVNVWEPKSINGGDEKYSVSLLISNTDTAQIAAIKKAVATIKSETEYLKKGVVKLPLRNGDEEREDDEVYKGHMFLNAVSNTPPGVVDAKVKPITDRSEFYSGCYGHVTITLYPFNKDGNKGIAVGLNNLMKVKDGERLDGISTAEDDFSDFLDDTASDDFLD
jgi:hypothetical protein